MNKTYNSTKTYTATYKFDDDLWERLQEYYKLPWFKRIFKKPPKPHHHKEG